MEPKFKVGEDVYICPMTGPCAGGKYEATIVNSEYWDYYSVSTHDDEIFPPSWTYWVDQPPSSDYSTKWDESGLRKRYPPSEEGWSWQEELKKIDKEEA